MAIRAWAQYYDWVLPELPGSPPTGLVDEICRAVSRDFCDETKVYQVELTPINIVAGTASYNLATADPTNLEVSEVLDVWHNSNRLTPKTRDELKRLYLPRWQDKTGTPEFYTQYDQNNLVLVPYPDKALTAGLQVTAAIMPTLASVGLIDVIFDRWAEDLAKGIKAQMMLQPKKPWSNPELANYYWGHYEAARDNTKSSVQKSFVRARPRTRGRFF